MLKQIPGQMSPGTCKTSDLFNVEPTSRKSGHDTIYIRHKLQKIHKTALNQ